MAAAPPGTTLEVMAGTYAESVALNKLLTLHGAQAGVDACGRVGGRIDHRAARRHGPGAQHRLGRLDHRRLHLLRRHARHRVHLRPARRPAAARQPHRRIHRQRRSSSNDSGIDINVHQNAIDGGSKVGGGGLFHLDTDSFAGLHFTANCIGNGPTATGFFVDGNHNVGVSVTPRAPDFSGNAIDGCATGANLGSRAFGGGTITNNTFSNNAFDGLQGGIQNTTISQNLFTGNGRSGLALTSFGNGAADRGGQNDLITNNCFTGNGFAQGGEGVFLSATQAAGTIATNQLTQNNFSNNNVGARYSGSESIGAENNYWGCVTGANTGTCDTVTNANVDTDPFLSAAAAGPVECVTCTQDPDCDDALACNGTETCNIGLALCAAGTPPDCSSAADSCNSGLCTEPAGACVPDPLPNGTLCGNALICSVHDQCTAGVCLPTSPDSDGDGVCDANERLGLSLRKVQIKDLLTRPDSDSWKVLGELDTTSSPGDFIDAITANGIEVIVFHDDAPLTQVAAFTFSAAQCTERRGTVRCRDTASRSKLILAKRSAPDFFRVKMQIKKQDLSAPGVADTPLSVSLRTTEASTVIDRSDEIGPSGCSERPGSLQCRQAP